MSLAWRWRIDLHTEFARHLGVSLPLHLDVIMDHETYPAPVQFKGVTISSTFRDLKEHRAALIDAIDGQGLKPVAMEHDAAKVIDVIDSSLQMVRDGSAYIGVISRRYGQTPRCPDRNPSKLSITELEFNEAQRLGRPILLFVMGEDHPVREADVEANASNRKKLRVFRERAKQMGPGSLVHRVYASFDSLEDFRAQAIQSVAELRRFLDEQKQPSPGQAAEPVPVSGRGAPIPAPPALYAEPPYIGSHRFVGRKAQLEALSDWAEPADPHPVLLFEAIGGTGKSMLTWEWTTRHAVGVRDDWAGRLWYSFYEKGAVMADFCQRALAYMTGQPLDDFRKKKTPELSELLLRHLQARPWLLVLDGLERVLVAYHRFDAAQVRDEEAGTTDEIAHRDPCAAIRPEDDDLLRALAAAGPSKLLLTTRLTPRVLLNQSGQAIPGVRRVPLPGLRPADAEELLRSCGVTGSSQPIQTYLQSHCDCHPLVTGVLAGLINDYLPDRGNFDAWAADADHGGQLNLADLDLVQKRNHILHAALDVLPEKSRQLLSTLAILSEAVDYATLSALNPHRPPEPEEVTKPARPEKRWDWTDLTNEQKEHVREMYEVAVQHRVKYEQDVQAWQASPEFRAAPQELAKTVHDLERRGLLQYDRQTRRYDLHPVVRGVAAGGLRDGERDHYGRRILDHFSQQARSPYKEAETLNDVRHGLQVVRTLVHMTRYNDAYFAFVGDLSEALAYNLEASPEILSLLRPFFPQGWAARPTHIGRGMEGYLVNEAANALNELGMPDEALLAYGLALQAALREKDWSDVATCLLNAVNAFNLQNRLRRCERSIDFALEIAALQEDLGVLFQARLRSFEHLALLGRWADAESMWRLLDPMGRKWQRAQYRAGDAEYEYANCRFLQGGMKEASLADAEKLATEGKNRLVVRALYRLRGQWELDQGRWSAAAASLHEAVRMARGVGHTDAQAETQLAIAKFNLQQLPEAYQEAERLAHSRDVAHRSLAELWLLLGDREKAREHALEAYKRAWADGEPYVYRYELNKARALLEQLGADVPDLPPYDPVSDEKHPWEDELVAAIAKLRARKGRRRASEATVADA